VAQIRKRLLQIGAFAKSNENTTFCSPSQSGIGTVLSPAFTTVVSVPNKGHEGPLDRRLPPWVEAPAFTAGGRIAALIFFSALALV